MCEESRKHKSSLRSPLERCSAFHRGGERGIRGVFLCWCRHCWHPACTAGLHMGSSLCTVTTAKDSFICRLNEGRAPKSAFPDLWQEQMHGILWRLSSRAARAWRPGKYCAIKAGSPSSCYCSAGTVAFLESQHQFISKGTVLAYVPSTGMVSGVIQKTGKEKYYFLLQEIKPV